MLKLKRPKFTTADRSLSRWVKLFLSLWSFSDQNVLRLDLYSDRFSIEFLNWFLASDNANWPFYCEIHFYSFHILSKTKIMIRLFIYRENKYATISSPFELSFPIRWLAWRGASTIECSQGYHRCRGWGRWWCSGCSRSPRFQLWGFRPLLHPQWPDKEIFAVFEIWLWCCKNQKMCFFSLKKFLMLKNQLLDNTAETLLLFEVR